ncbi:sugar porter family MFS transporter [Parapedobacter sp. DT-150]|uniref:sugar porter family MFS transporter n=1 Tax=Parapedobacter sp. DT-150 TaxID=3396162 RepID=UPI003F53EBE4
MNSSSYEVAASQAALPDSTGEYRTKFILLVSVVAALGGLLFGFDTAIISGTIPYITDYFELDAYLLGWAVSSIIAGCVLGATMAGRLADRHGRRFVLLICAAFFALSAIGVSLSDTLSFFIGFRVIGGLGVGAAAMVSPMYIAEMAPAPWRGRLVATYQLAIVTGILLAYLSNYWLADIGPNNWRWMFASQLVPAILFGLLLLLVPETPRWLAKMKRIDQAAAVLRKTGGEGYSQSEIARINRSFQEGRQISLVGLLSPLYRPIVGMGAMLAIFQQVTGINAILYYAPVIFKETGIETSNSLLQTIGVGVIMVLSTFIAIALVDRLGRRKLLLWGSLLMGASLLTVSGCFHYQYFDNYVVLAAMLVYVGTFGATLGAVTWVYLSEVFPNRIRGLALAVSTIVLWVADFVVTYTFPIMVKELGTAATLVCYAVCCAVAFIYMLLKLPETKNTALEDIEKLLIKSK